jgi:hypothetical protein
MWFQWTYLTSSFLAWATHSLSFNTWSYQQRSEDTLIFGKRGYWLTCNVKHLHGILDAIGTSNFRLIRQGNAPNDWVTENSVQHILTGTCRSTDPLRSRRTTVNGIQGMTSDFTHCVHCYRLSILSRIASTRDGPSFTFNPLIRSRMSANILGLFKITGRDSAEIVNQEVCHKF